MSDEGFKFLNKAFQAALDKYGVKEDKEASLYHLETSGKVEVSN